MLSPIDNDLSSIDNNFVRPSNFFSQEIEKMNKGELLIEDILDNKDIVQDVKTHQNSPFLSFFTKEILLKLIDYSMKMPKSNDQKIGYLYPFNATEILCSLTPTIQNKLMHEKKNDNLNNHNNTKKEEEKNENGIQNLNINFNEENNETNREIQNLKIDNNRLGIADINKLSFVRYDVIDYLFNFLRESNSENNSNFILVGYFSKILSNLIDFQSDKIINYIYDYPDKDNFDILSLLLNLLNKKGICEIIQKLLFCETENISELENKKINLIQNIMKEFKVTKDNLKYISICNTLCNTLSNKSFFIFFMNNRNLVQILFELTNNDNDKKDFNKDKDILNLYININENILKNLERKYTPDIYRESQNDFLNSKEKDMNNSIDEDKKYNALFQSNIKDILKLLFNLLKKNEFNFLSDFYKDKNDESKNGQFISTYQQKQKKLGMNKLLQVEYIRTLLDLIINSYASNFHKKDLQELISILDKKKIFCFLHEIFFNFPFCNIFQIYYIQIIDIITNIYTPNYLVNCFIIGNNNINNSVDCNKKNLISLIIEHMIQKNEFIFNSKRKALNPCLIYEVNIINQLINCNNDTVRSIIEENKDLIVFNEILAGDLSIIINSKLLYNEENEIDSSSLFDFGKRNLLDIINEGIKIYNIYKKGGDYKMALKERKENKKIVQ